VNRQSLTYGFMQEPLRSGEVLVAWDNAARLKTALEAEPDAYTAFPAPRGPKGRGFMPVVVGLGIPKTAPDPDASFELIRYLTREDTLAETVRSVGFLPPTRGGPPGDLPPALRQLAEAGRAQASDPDGILTLLPTGLKANSRLYSKVFDDTFHQIIVGGADIRATLDSQAKVLGEVVQCDTPMEVYDRPRTRFVGEFIGTPPMNFLRASPGGAAGSGSATPSWPPPGWAATTARSCSGSGPSTWR
jgi:multiple sugar transport system substrate-binding protein